MTLFVVFYLCSRVALVWASEYVTQPSWDGWAVASHVSRSMSAFATTLVVVGVLAGTTLLCMACIVFRRALIQAGMDIQRRLHYMQTQQIAG
jgi:hypothetical protein